MEIKIDSLETSRYIENCCEVLHCSPSDLVRDAMLIHCKAFRIINRSVMNACFVLDFEPIDLENHGNKDL